MEPQKQFGKLRNWFFPIYTEELIKFLPLCIINFCFTYGYSSLRVIKDALVIGEGGAEAVYYLKAYGVTPAVIFFTILYSYLSKFFERDGRFNFVIIYLISFFFIFLFVLYPHSNFFRLDNFYYLMMSKFPSLRGLWSIVRNWTASLFYIHSELWGSYALAVCFWTLANDITTLKQSKRFYGFFPLAGNIGSAVAGFSVTYLFFGNPEKVLYSILILSIISLITYNIFFGKYYRFVESFLVKIFNCKPELKNDSTTTPNLKIASDNKPTKKIKLSLKESLAFLSNSKYLVYIAILVLCYNMSTSLIESVIKDRWAEYANGDKILLLKIGGLQIMVGGILSTIFAFFATYLQRVEWIYAALFTPILFLIIGTLFFIFLFFDKYTNNYFEYFNISSLFGSVILGWFNLVLIKASKYSFFEPTKESTYIPLNKETKIKGKAAVDGIGARLGKGISSLLLTICILPLGNGKIKNVRSIIFVIITIILLIWIWAVKKLNTKFKIFINKNSSD